MVYSGEDLQDLQGSTGLIASRAIVLTTCGAAMALTTSGLLWSARGHAVAPEKGELCG